jgi:hypothetical protein
MRNQTILLSLFVSLTASGCNTVECASGTIERDGKCEPSEGPVDPARCGPFTELVGDRCVPMFPPTECDPGTTEPSTDDTTGVTTCIGTVTGGCSSAIACPTPASGSRQTICGQLYDFETGEKFQLDPTGMASGRCDPAAPAASGPCALQVNAYDAYAFGNNPTTPVPLPRGDMYIDECGRYKLQDIDINGTGPFIGIGVDDASGLGPTGVTVTAAVATPKMGQVATKDLEGFIVKLSTAQAWQASGGPPLSGGIYAPVFRQHKLPVTAPGTPFTPQTGVMITRNGATIPTNDFYFQAAQTTRTSIDTAATSTGANGTVLVTNASVSELTAYAGQGGLGAGCRWEPHAGASLPGIVFIQVFRKLDIVGQTCND